MTDINDFLQEKFDKFNRIAGFYTKQYNGFDYESFEDAFQDAAQITYKKFSGKTYKHLNSTFEMYLKRKYISYWKKARTKQYYPNCDLDSIALFNFWDHCEFPKERITEVISDFTRLAIFNLKSFGSDIQIDYPKELSHLESDHGISIADILGLCYCYKKPLRITNCEIEKDFSRRSREKKRIFVGINGSQAKKDFFHKFENNDYTKKKVKGFLFSTLRRCVAEILSDDRLFNQFKSYEGTYVEGAMFLSPKKKDHVIKEEFGISSLENMYWVAQKFYRDKPSYPEYIEYLEERMANEGVSFGNNKQLVSCL